MSQRIVRRLKIIAAGVLVTGVVLLLINYVLQERYRKITVGRDTTVVSGPFLADGRIDFLSAVNGKLAEGVTPENNAAVPLYLGTVQKDDLEGWRLEAFLKAWGVKEVPKERVPLEYFTTFMFEREIKTATRPQEVQEHDEELKDQWDEEEACRTRPWKKEGHPNVFAWLERNRRALELAKESSRRERYYSPLVNRPDLGTTMTALIAPAGKARQLANLLLTDAMLAVESKDVARWREDVMAVRRMGLLMMNSGSQVEVLVALAIRALADDGIMAGLGILTPQQAREMLVELRKLPRTPDINDCADQYERLGLIGFLCEIAYFGPSVGEVERNDPTVPLPQPRSMGFQTPIHFDELLREHNRLVDRQVAAGRLPTYSQQKGAFEALKAECVAVTSKLKGVSTAAVLKGMVYAGGFHQSNVMQNKTLEKARLTELALLMVIYRGEHGSYPKTLAELGDVGEAGRDLFADGAPVRFAPETLTIYSVGPNQRDDKGIYDRPVVKRQFTLTPSPSPAVDFPDDIAVKLP